MAATDFETAVSQSITASNQLHDVINGSTTETVTTDSGEIPSLRKSLTDNFFFLDPIDWVDGGNSTKFNQLYKFTDGLLWYAPAATIANPIPLGDSPTGDSNWLISPFSISAPVAPRAQDRQYGDGVITTFDTPTTLYVNPTSIIARVDGIYQSSVVDYTVNNDGKLVFISGAPPQGAAVDITLYTPVIKAELTEEDLPKYTNIVYKSSPGRSRVENMVNGNPLSAAIGDICKTGGTTWEFIDSTGEVTLDNYRALNAINISDFKKDTDVDDTASIQAVFDLGGKVEIAPLRSYEISETLTIKKERTQINLGGIEIKNSVNEKLMLQFGDPNATNGFARNCKLENFKLTGNSKSLGGMVLWSSAAVDDKTGASWSDSSKKNVIKNFEINEIQEGASLTVYSWANSFYDFTVYREPGMLACKNGLILAYECNSNTFCNTYITGTDEEGIKTETGALTGAVVANNFTGSTTVQYCGGPTFSNIDIDRAWNTTFDVIYGEIHADSTAPFIKVGGASINVKFKNVYLLVNTSADVPVLFDTEGRSTEFGGVYLNANSAKTVGDIFNQGNSSTASMRLEDITIKGDITYTSVINSSRPYVWMDEDKIDIFSNDASGGNRLNLVSPRPTIRIEDSVNNDSKKEFIDGGRWKVVTRDESAGVDSDFISYDYTRPVSFTNGFGSPEGTITANAGSWHSSTSGALYVKVSGSGDTGWRKVLTET